MKNSEFDMFVILIQKNMLIKLTLIFWVVGLPLGP